MSPQDMEKLLGGYATDTLTDEERRALFAAALGNQALFDALADEQALRELLQDSTSRAQLLRVLREEKAPAMSRMMAWLRRPSVLALASAVAAGIVVIAVVGPGRMKTSHPAEVAEFRDSRPEPQASPPEARTAPPPAAPAPARAPAGKREAAEKDAAPAKPAEPTAQAPVAAAPPPPPPAGAQSPSAQSQAGQSQAAQSSATDNTQQFVPAAPPQARALPAAAPPTSVTAGAPAVATLSAPVPRARDLYYAPQPGFSNLVDEQRPAKAAKRQEPGRTFGGAMSRVSPARASTRLPGVRYAILKRNPDGTFTEADPSGVFARGDALRLRFETNQPGTLTVMERQPDGKWSLRMTARMQEGQPVFMPAESTIEIRQPGERHFFVRFARNLQPDAKMDEATPTPGLIQDKVATSMYVVNRRQTMDAAVAFEVTVVAQ